MIGKRLNIKKIPFYIIYNFVQKNITIIAAERTLFYIFR